MTVKEQERRKVKVGDTFYMTRRHGRGGTYAVEKVGRKYFYIDGIKFFIESKSEVTEYISSYSLYESKEALGRIVRKDLLHSAIRRYFSAYTTKKELSLESLETVAKILEIEV